MIVVAALVATGCANRVADVTRVIGPGPVRPDPDRGVLVSTVEGDEGVSIGVPVIASGPPGREIGRCSARAAWVDRSVRDTILAMDPEDVTVALPSLATLTGVDVPSPVVMPEGGVRDAPVVAERATLTTPPIRALEDVNSVGDLDATLLLELWLDVPAPTPPDPCPPPPPERQSNLYVIDFHTVRPIEGGATGTGALVIAIIAITGLVAVGVGGP